MRRTRLARKTPLKSDTPLRRTGFLPRSALHASPATHRSPAKSRPFVIPAKVRTALAVRSGGWCEIAAPGCTGRATEAAHRVRVGMGGRKGVTATGHHVLSNLLHACHDCHQVRGHRNPAQAYANGWMLREHQDPATEPCLYRGSWRLLDDSGSTTPINPEGALMTVKEQTDRNLTVQDDAGNFLVFERHGDGSVRAFVQDRNDVVTCAAGLSIDDRLRIVAFLAHDIDAPTDRFGVA